MSSLENFPAGAGPAVAGTMPTRASVQHGAAATPGRRLLARAAEDVRADEATLWLISDDRERMDGTLNHGRTPQVLEALSVPIPQSVVGMVASTGVGASIGPDDYHHPAPTQAGAAGTNAIYTRNPLERHFRDIHVAIQHNAGFPVHYESAGKVLMGLRPSEPGW